MICPCFQMTIYYTASDRSIGMIEAAEAMLLLPPWMSTAVSTLWDEGWVTKKKKIDLSGFMSYHECSLPRSCVTIAGGFTAFCLGYTDCYGDIDIFCTKTAFQKLVQKVGDLQAGIRLVR